MFIHPASGGTTDFDGELRAVADKKLIVRSECNILDS